MYTKHGEHRLRESVESMKALAFRDQADETERLEVTDTQWPSKEVREQVGPGAVTDARNSSQGWGSGHRSPELLGDPGRLGLKSIPLLSRLGS